ncbi:MAG: hypothetical protein ACRD4H_09095 [Candidatus Acidiferrales bacterium]
MTDREFEDEAVRSSLLSAGMLSVQKIVDPSHRVEYVQQYDKHVESDAAQSHVVPPSPAKNSPPK